MNVMLDFLLCVIAAVVIFMITGKNTIITAARFAAAVLAVGIALTVTYFGAAPLSAALPNPLTGTAVTDMAELSGVDTSGWNTSSHASLVDYDKLRDSEAFADLLDEYGVTPEDVDTAVKADPDNKVMAAAVCMTAPLWRAIVGSLLQLFLVVVLYFGLLAMIRSLLYKKFPKDRKRKSAPLTALFAVLTMVVIVAYFVVPVFEAFRPFSVGWMNMLEWDSACANSVIYRVFRVLYLL